jgi:hypothetical protein
LLAGDDKNKLKFIVNVVIANKTSNMSIDPRSDLNGIINDEFRTKFSDCQLLKQRKLHGYGGEHFHLIGKIFVSIVYGNQYYVQSALVFFSKH